MWRSLFFIYGSRRANTRSGVLTKNKDHIVTRSVLMLQWMNGVDVRSPTLVQYGSTESRYSAGRRSWVGVLTPSKYVGWVRVCFDSPKMSHFVIQNSCWICSASFTSSRMEDLCQKWKVKNNFSRCVKQFDVLTWLTLTPSFYDRSTLHTLQDSYWMQERWAQWVF